MDSKADAVSRSLRPSLGAHAYLPSFVSSDGRYLLNWKAIVGLGGGQIVMRKSPASSKLSLLPGPAFIVVFPAQIVGSEV